MALQLCTLLVCTPAATAQVSGPDLDDPNSQPSRHEQIIEESKLKQRKSRVEYTADPSLPDGVAYQSFINRVLNTRALGRDDAVHWIVDKFKLKHDDSGFAHAESLFDRLYAAGLALEDDIDVMETQLMCSEARRARTKDETYATLNLVDDTREEMAQDHLELLRQQLTGAEYGQLLGILRKNKKGIYYSKSDHAATWEAIPSMDVRDFVEGVCSQ